MCVYSRCLYAVSLDCLDYGAFSWWKGLLCVVVEMCWNDVLCRVNDLLHVAMGWFIRCMFYGTMSFVLVVFGVA